MMTLVLVVVGCLLLMVAVVVYAAFRDLDDHEPREGDRRRDD